MALEEADRYVHWRQDTLRTERRGGRVDRVHRLLPGTGPAVGASRMKNELAKRAYEVLCDLRPSEAPVDEAEWKQKCSEFLPKKDASGKWTALPPRAKPGLRAR
jgi:hypothetical protein